MVSVLPWVGIESTDLKPRLWASEFSTGTAKDPQQHKMSLANHLFNPDMPFYISINAFKEHHD